ncbi:MAG TPA: exodeoxyribonuclease VII large subunit [Gemmatimonadetes bacterium]|nr:exodeoxyribonuclease VII large subunit [Gemmatimonadota bacterium]
MPEDPSFDSFRGLSAEPELDSTTPPPERIWSVSQVNSAIRKLIEDSVDALWVRGEVGNWRRYPSGHCYFSVKDDRSELRCVMFARDASALPTDPDDGMEVRLFGNLTLYEKRGAYQMSVRRLESEGAEGLWRIAFEKLRSQLEAEGLLDPSRKRPLPAYPAVVGVVTSTSGAALRDIISVLGRRAPWVRVLVRGTRVQGEGAANEIAEAIEDLVATGEAEVIIVGRGGGSIEDLWAFNEEPVARAIAKSPVPVVSAVGHEVDVTISDLVADLRSPTPSAAAEAVVPDGVVIREELRHIPHQLSKGLRGILHHRKTMMDNALSRLGLRIERRVQSAQQMLDHDFGRLQNRVRGILDRGRQRLIGVEGKLDALSPLATLRRGYSVARTGDGQILKSVRDFVKGDSFTLRVSDGEVIAEAKEILAGEP